MSVDTGQTAPETVEAPPTGVHLTETAAEKVKALLDQEGRDDLALRIAVQPGGCSGPGNVAGCGPRRRILYQCRRCAF